MPKKIDDKIYDTIIVGGGIAGLYAALRESDKGKDILLLEASHYWGGRIKTHYHPQYEIGAGRFHKNHKRLFALIKRFGLTPIPIDDQMDYLDPNEGLLPHVENYLQKIVSRMTLKETMRDQTFYVYCVELLGKAEADHFVNALGFHEPYYKNAYDYLKALQTDFIQGDYFILKEGMSELCRRIQKEIKGTCRLNHRVESIEREGKYLKVDGMLTHKIVITIPPSLFRYFPILEPFHKITDQITQGPLLRVYAKYKTFPLSFTTTTELVSRHIIPIGDGVVMIAYVEDKDIHPFLDKGKLKPISEIRKVLEPIHQILGLSEPEWIKPYLWAIGTHAWKPGPILNMPKIEGVTVCGEAFSERQSWVEGALESV
jgi:hypothetical protein